MLKESEQESLTPEGDEQQPEADNESDEAEKLTKAEETAKKAEELAKNQKIRAEKAEAELKKLKAKESETPKNEEQLNEPDYAKEAFLEQRGVQHADDKKIVYDEAKRLKLPLIDVLSMEHIKTKLKSVQTQREAESG